MILLNQILIPIILIYFLQAFITVFGLIVDPSEFKSKSHFLFYLFVPIIPILYLLGKAVIKFYTNFKEL